jgi:hypothetical protein
VINDIPAHNGVGRPIDIDRAMVDAVNFVVFDNRPHAAFINIDTLFVAIGDVVVTKYQVGAAFQHDGVAAGLPAHVAPGIGRVREGAAVNKNVLSVAARRVVYDDPRRVSHVDDAILHGESMAGATDRRPADVLDAYPFECHVVGRDFNHGCFQTARNGPAQCVVIPAEVVAAAYRGRVSSVGLPCQRLIQRDSRWIP